MINDKNYAQKILDADTLEKLIEANPAARELSAEDFAEFRKGITDEMKGLVASAAFLKKFDKILLPPGSN